MVQGKVPKIDEFIRRFRAEQAVYNELSERIGMFGFARDFVTPLERLKPWRSIYEPEQLITGLRQDINEIMAWNMANAIRAPHSGELEEIIECLEKLFADITHHRNTLAVADAGFERRLKVCKTSNRT
jgi:hypothetical protein